MGETEIFVPNTSVLLTEKNIFLESYDNRQVNKVPKTNKTKRGVTFLCPFFFRYQDPTPPSDTYPYNTYGVTCTEVEVDVLTGEREILRTDILNDCGER